MLSDSETAALAQEISGATALRTVEGLSRLHRMRGSQAFEAAGEIVLAELQRAGLADALRIVLPADGKVFYGTQRSRPAWNVRFAELWEIDATGARIERLASWDESPLGLAQDSSTADVPNAGLVDVGAGTKESDYSGKEIAGRLVLTSSQPGAVAELAVGKLGAAGIVSWAQNQQQGWWGDDESLVRWGHLDTFARTKTFAFMVSPARARRLAARLAAGEDVRFSAQVDATTLPGAYSIPTATIVGVDAEVGKEEIVFSCHLDHPRPGANDNASGCATILEVARTLTKLIREGRLPPPRRTLRFVWPPEVEGTHALLVGRPEMAKNFRAAIHLDMVGGGPETKAVFHVTRGAASLPSFIYDLAEEQAKWLNEQTLAYATTGVASFPLLAAGGGKEPLRAEVADLTLGSDHEVYTDSSFGIPALYFNDWPDRYIHTDHDVPANLDATKLGRVAFLAAAAGWSLANLDENDATALWQIERVAALRRAATTSARQDRLPAAEAANLGRFAATEERAIAASTKRFLASPAAQVGDAAKFFATFDALVAKPTTAAKKAGPVYRRNPAHPGTTFTFGYSWLPDHLDKERVSALRLPEFTGDRGGGDDYTYEALNLVDGKRSSLEIRDALSAIYGPVPLELVEEYLAALREAQLIDLVDQLDRVDRVDRGRRRDRSDENESRHPSVH
ncbi:MAG: M28 family peptidase [Thermoanaerobaculia bacterium]